MSMDNTGTSKDNDKDDHMEKFKNIINKLDNQQKIIDFVIKNAPKKTNNLKKAFKDFENDTTDEDSIKNIAKLLVDIKDDVDKQKTTGGKKHKTRKYKKKDKKKKGKKKTMKKRGKKSRK